MKTQAEGVRREAVMVIDVAGVAAETKAEQLDGENTHARNHTKEKRQGHTSVTNHQARDEQEFPNWDERAWSDIQPRAPTQDDAQTTSHQ